jgi:hypothetical protein
MKSKPRFKVAEIALDEDGVYHIKWLGNHGDQGGITYRWGSVGITGLDGVGMILEDCLSDVQDIQLEQVRNRSAEIEEKEADDAKKVSGGDGTPPVLGS